MGCGSSKPAGAAPTAAAPTAAPEQEKKLVLPLPAHAEVVSAFSPEQDAKSSPENIVERSLDEVTGDKSPALEVPGDKSPALKELEVAPFLDAGERTSPSMRRPDLAGGSLGGDGLDNLDHGEKDLSPGRPGPQGQKIPQRSSSSSSRDAWPFVDDSAGGALPTLEDEQEILDHLLGQSAALEPVDEHIHENEERVEEVLSRLRSRSPSPKSFLDSVLEKTQAAAAEQSSPSLSGQFSPPGGAQSRPRSRSTRNHQTESKEPAFSPTMAQKYAFQKVPDTVGYAPGKPVTQAKSRALDAAEREAKMRKKGEDNKEGTIPREQLCEERIEVAEEQCEKAEEAELKIEDLGKKKTFVKTEVANLQTQIMLDALSPKRNGGYLSPKRQKEVVQAIKTGSPVRELLSRSAKQVVPMPEEPVVYSPRG
ncbi:unnamed protein product [Amoebophrya sp. A25]|nr:unnamed protein product [Amoebophrya sp. A25]|eukprot:GSA25T00027400001.1